MRFLWSPRTALISSRLLALFAVLFWRSLRGTDSVRIDLPMMRVDASEYQLEANIHVYSWPSFVPMIPRLLTFVRFDSPPLPFRDAIREAMKNSRNRPTALKPFSEPTNLIVSGYDYPVDRRVPITHHVFFFPMVLLLPILAIQPAAWLIAIFARRGGPPRGFDLGGTCELGAAAEARPKGGPIPSPRMSAEIRVAVAIFGLKLVYFSIYLFLMNSFHIDISFDWLISAVMSAPLTYSYMCLPSLEITSILIYIICMTINTLAWTYLLTPVYLALTKRVIERRLA